MILMCSEQIFYLIFNRISAWEFCSSFR